VRQALILAATLGSSCEPLRQLSLATLLHRELARPLRLCLWTTRGHLRSPAGFHRIPADHTHHRLLLLSAAKATTSLPDALRPGVAVEEEQRGNSLDGDRARSTRPTSVAQTDDVGRRYGCNGCSVPVDDNFR
jgi:hypothetical protein